jgi:hypothetical protein
MRDTLGRISPRAPAISQTPMKRRNHTGMPRSICEVICSADITSLLLPAKRNSADRDACVIHNTTLVLLTVPPLPDIVPKLRVIVAIAVLLVLFVSGHRSRLTGLCKDVERTARRSTRHGNFFSTTRNSWNASQKVGLQPGWLLHSFVYKPNLGCSAFYTLPAVER